MESISETPTRSILKISPLYRAVHKRSPSSTSTSSTSSTAASPGFTNPRPDQAVRFHDQVYQCVILDASEEEDWSKIGGSDCLESKDMAGNDRYIPLQSPRVAKARRPNHSMVHKDWKGIEVLPPTKLKYEAVGRVDHRKPTAISYFFPQLPSIPELSTCHSEDRNSIGWHSLGLERNPSYSSISQCSDSWSSDSEEDSNEELGPFEENASLDVSSCVDFLDHAEEEENRALWENI